jgi:hypothetical protein
VPEPGWWRLVSVARDDAAGKDDCSTLDAREVAGGTVVSVVVIGDGVDSESSVASSALASASTQLCSLPAGIAGGAQTPLTCLTNSSAFAWQPAREPKTRSNSGLVLTALHAPDIALSEIGVLVAVVEAAVDVVVSA